MMAERPDQLRIEFWAFLRSRGFPTEINDETIQRAVEMIEFQAFLGKRLGLRSWCLVEGGLHSDDVALVWLLAESLVLKQGVDWDWELEPDNYHYSVAYVHSFGINDLSGLVDLYNDATLVLLQVQLLADGKAGEELQQAFSEEWKRLNEEKQQPAKLLKEALKQIGF